MKRRKFRLYYRYAGVDFREPCYCHCSCYLGFTLEGPCLMEGRFKETENLVCGSIGSEYYGDS